MASHELFSTSDMQGMANNAQRTEEPRSSRDNQPLQSSRNGHTNALSGPTNTGSLSHSLSEPTGAGSSCHSLSEPTSAGSSSILSSECVGCLREARVHFCRRPSPMQALFIIVFCTLYIGVFTLVSTGHLQAAADQLKLHLGAWSHFIFFGIFIYTGVVFGYGWTIAVIASGYVLGWSAIITVNVGSALGGAVGFLTARRCLKGSVKRKVASLPPAWARRFEFFSYEISRSTRGYFMLSATLRNSSLLTVGMINAFDGAMTEVTLLQHMLCIVVTSQPMMCLDVYIGTLIDRLSQPAGGTSMATGNNATATSGSQAEAQARRTGVIVQISIAVTMAFCMTLWARQRIKRLERVHQQDQEARRRANGSASASQTLSTPVAC